MEDYSIDSIVEKLNEINLEPDTQTYSEYMAVCDELEELVFHLSSSGDELSMNILRNIMPAFENQDVPTDIILSGAYFLVESDDDFLKKILYETELNQTFDPVVIGGNWLKTPNQMFTQRTRYNIAEFLYSEDEIDESEFKMFTSYDDSEDGEKVDNRDMGIVAKFYDALTEDEREALSDESEIPLFYLDQIKKIDSKIQDQDEYKKALLTLDYAMFNDKERFMMVLDEHLKIAKIAKEDSRAYMNSLNSQYRLNT